MQMQKLNTKLFSVWRIISVFTLIGGVAIDLSRERSRIACECGKVGCNASEGLSKTEGFKCGLWSFHKSMEAITVSYHKKSVK